MRKRSAIRVMLRLAGLVRPLALPMTGAVLMGLLGHVCAAGITVLAGAAVLNGLGLSGIGLGTAFVWLAVCAVLRGGFRYLEQRTNHDIAFRLLALIRDRVFGALRRLAPAKLVGRDRGNLIAVITSDIELLEVFYAHTISPLCIWALFALLVSLLIALLHPLLGLMALISQALIGVVVPLLTHRFAGHIGARFRAQAGELSSFVLCSLRGLAETIRYGGGRARLEAIDRQTDALLETEKSMKNLAGKSRALTDCAILFLDLAMLTAAAQLCLRGSIGFDGALLAVLGLMSSFGPAVSLSALGATLQNTLAAGDRVLNILEEEPETRDVSGREPAAFGGCRTENLCFRYADGQAGGEDIILDQISIDIPKGAVVGITGRSGSGKSTLLRLMMRFWQAASGRILIGERDINDINTDHLRAMESYVTQETHLFRDSIAENLRIAKQDATQAEMEAACKMASVHDFIMSLPGQYETPVGELGDTLSGGERQRIGLARAFLHDAPFLLLDEPTSNLDSLNEAVVLRSVREQAKGKTVALVSHRPSTMRIADAVYSVEHGRIS